MPRRALAALSSLLFALLVAAPVSAAPVTFPPLPDGTVEVRDEADVAPYLAAWKAHQLQRTFAIQAPATANQLAYDVRGYALDLSFATSTSTVSGTVRVQATVTSGPLTTMDLDLAANMVVDGITSGGTAVTWTRATNLLTVNLDRTYATGEGLDVRVTYHGTPGTASFGFTTANARPLIWSLSEPYGARTWWPCKDAPEDKADSVYIRFTVPTGLVTASNGRLLASADNGVTATTIWRESHPIATYLVSIESYPYTLTTDWYRPTPTDSMRLDFYNFPESVAGAAAVQAKVKTMIGAFAGDFGEYPFLDEKYGHSQFLFGGGMEHQTCTSLGTFNESVVAHELGHQWWGDAVTCRDFHHIWVNEGFATYSEALWSEAVGGAAAYHADINLNRFYGAGSVYVPDATNENRIFDSNLSYNKGSWVLHMLRHVLGDTVFFAGLKRYGQDRAYGTGTTEDVQAAFQAVSGRDLTKYFQQWVYGEYYPVYSLAWSAAAGGGGYDVTLTLRQTQSWQLFTMPIDVRVTTTAGPRTFVVQDSLASQTFTLHVDAEPTDVALDPDDWLLRQIQYEISHPTFDRAVLVVNGVDWANYGTEITTAYTDKALQGDYPIDFWDHFAAPAAGYPATLPTPLGHGPVPPGVIGRYRNVIWIGNNFNGDLDSWVQTPILSYLRAGGNVLLMARQGDVFVTDSLRTYLGITFTNTGATLTDCLATRPGLVAMTRTAAQSLCSLFDTTRTRTDTALLFKATSGFTPQRGIGVIRTPLGGAGLRPNGGRFAFVSGRPYRWTHTLAKSNVNTILGTWFQEPVSGVAVGRDPAAAPLSFAPVRPNPAHGEATLRFTLPQTGPVTLEVIDASGRRVCVLPQGTLAAGPHEVRWDGRDATGRLTAPGLYWARLTSHGTSRTQRFVRLD